MEKENACEKYKDKIKKEFETKRLGLESYCARWDKRVITKKVFFNISPNLKKKKIFKGKPG